MMILILMQRHLCFLLKRNLWRDEPEQLMIYYQFNSQDKEGFIDTFKEYALHPVIQEVYRLV